MKKNKRNEKQKCVDFLEKLAPGWRWMLQRSSMAENEPENDKNFSWTKMEANICPDAKEGDIISIEIGGNKGGQANKFNNKRRKAKIR